MLRLPRAPAGADIQPVRIAPVAAVCPDRCRDLAAAALRQLWLPMHNLWSLNVLSKASQLGLLVLLAGCVAGPGGWWTGSPGQGVWYNRALDEMQACHAARHRAQATLRQLDGRFASADYRCGFEQAFCDVATGFRGDVPPQPPAGYWSWRFRSDAGRCRVDEWYAGYAAGLMAARAEGFDQHRIGSPPVCQLQGGIAPGLDQHPHSGSIPHYPLSAGDVPKTAPTMVTPRAGVFHSSQSGNGLSLPASGTVTQRIQL